MHAFAILCLVSVAVATDITVYKAARCAPTSGKDVSCVGEGSDICCSPDELSDLEYFESAGIANKGSRDIVTAFSSQGDPPNLCGAALGSSKSCYSYDEQIISGAKWRTQTGTAAIMENTTAEMDTVNECPDKSNAGSCVARQRPSHVNGYFNGKTYLVKMADFDKATFFALKTEEEKFRYFEERVDIIWDFIAGEAEDAKTTET